LLSKK